MSPSDDHPILTPFDLPEIRFLIGSFLDHNDRINCTLISKTWRDTMTSLVWESVTLVDVSHPSVTHRPHQTISVPYTILRKKTSLVKTLIIQSNLFEDYFDLPFPILQTVSFWPRRALEYPDDPSGATFEGLARLIQQNPSISQLKMGVSKGRQPAPDA